MTTAAIHRRRRNASHDIDRVDATDAASLAVTARCAHTVRVLTLGEDAWGDATVRVTTTIAATSATNTVVVVVIAAASGIRAHRGTAGAVCATRCTADEL